MSEHPIEGLMTTAMNSIKDMIIFKALLHTKKDSWLK